MQLNDTNSHIIKTDLQACIQNSGNIVHIKMLTVTETAKTTTKLEMEDRLDKNKTLKLIAYRQTVFIL